MGACYCDYDSPAFYTARRPVARKEHVCDECRRPILPGDRYESVTAKWEDSIETYKTCIDCLALRDEINTKSNCFCWSHGGLLEDIRNQVQEEGYRIPGLRMLAGRYEVKRRQYWVKHHAKRGQQNENRSKNQDVS